MATTNFSNWAWQTQHVESRLQQGEYVSAESVLIAAGPPSFSDVSFQNVASSAASGADIPTGTQSGAVYPIGMVENFGLSQNKQLQRLFEIGSKRSYFIPGRNIGSFSMGRVLFWGPSLMRVMYAYYPESLITMANGALMSDSSNDDAIQLSGTADPSLPFIEVAPGTSAGAGLPADQKGAFYMNLASDLFNQPLGLLVYMKDVRDQVYSAFYLEDVFIQSHSLNVNASSVLVAEGISCQYDQLVPVSIDGA